MHLTPADLYAMGMESRVAYKRMKALCAALGIAFPPKPDDHTPITPKE